MLRASGGLAAAALLGGATTTACGRSDQPDDTDARFGELDARIEELMARYAVPGVAVGVWHRGREHLRGFGVTNVDEPEPVTPDTLFRIASTSKTFTGTTVMRLAEAGGIDLDERVRVYLPEFTTSDPTVAERVTVRQLLNHTPGWHGDYAVDFGPGDDALAQYAAAISTLPQLTPLGSTFAYNNAAIALAGRVIEEASGTSYEQAVRDQVIDPLGLQHTGFSTDQLSGHRVALPHVLEDGRPVVDRDAWEFPRSLNPTGGLISSARDQLAYARFHLGDGTGPDGTTLLHADSLTAMRSNPGPGGTLTVELDGIGITWHLRPTVEGVHVVQHGGTVTGQHSGFYFVPDRDFALTVLTNSDGGAQLVPDLMYDDWALQHFAGVHNLPVRLRDLSPAELAAYEGRYTTYETDFDGQRQTTTTQLTADRGRLRYQALSEAGDPVDAPATTPAHLAFYRDDYVQPLNRDGDPMPVRADFVRDGDGRVQWLRFGGRLHRKIS
ncbi:serine hydrolase domain-containing protein [Mycolicibacterium thermoresistibile]